MKSALLRLLLLLLLTIAPVKATNIVLQWDASSDTNVVSYRLYWRTTAATNSISYLGVAGTTATITNAAGGFTYEIWATAFESQGIESDPSNVVEYSVPATFPTMPVLLSSSLVQTNGTLRIRIDWKPAPFEESVTGYNLNVLTNGNFFTNVFTTNTTASFVTSVKDMTIAYLSSSNFFGLSKSNLVGTYKQPQPIRMQFVFLTK